MTALAAALRELSGLFVEDGALALAVVAIVVLASLSAILFPAVPAATGTILLVGCLGVLFANVMTARNR
jgi:CBS-domain-containing membrane protein